jgi:hypothetical protein
MVKPFSYVVPVGSFGSVDEVWDLDGKVMVELDKRPLNLGVQDDTQPPPDPAAGPGGAQAQQQGLQILILEHLAIPLWFPSLFSFWVYENSPRR